MYIENWYRHVLNIFFLNNISSNTIMYEWNMEGGCLFESNTTRAVARVVFDSNSTITLKKYDSLLPYSTSILWCYNHDVIIYTSLGG